MAMEKEDMTFILPAIGFVIMFFIAIWSLDTPSNNLPRLSLFFALGAVMFVAGYIGNSIRSLK